jgi:hypothetical protein
MPTLSHDLLVDILRESKDLVCELFALQTGIRLHDFFAEAASPQDLRRDDAPDHLLVFHGADRRAKYALMIEVQLQADARKAQLWPHYISALRTVLQCPVSLLVVAPDPRVARWARTPIELCHGGSTTPVVISWPEVPRVVELDQARRLPELALLSALAHPELDVVIAACNGLIAMADLPRSWHYCAGLRAALGHLFDDEPLGADPSAAELNDPHALMMFLRTRRAREPVVQLLLELVRTRMHSVTKRDEDDVRFIATKDGAIIHLLSGLARAQTADHVRQAIERATVCRVHGIRPQPSAAPPPLPHGARLAMPARLGEGSNPRIRTDDAPRASSTAGFAAAAAAHKRKAA